MSPGSPAPIHVTALGVRVAVTFDDAPDGAREAFAHGWSRAVTADGAATAAEDAVVVAAPGGIDVASALHQLSTTVTLAAIEAAAGRLWMLHAAGLSDPTSGAAVALVAPSGTGKSTAARTLGRHLGYLSDETVGVTPEGVVLPHAKPVSIVQPHAVKQQISPDDAGLRATPADAALQAVVLLDRDGSATPWLEPVRTAAALPVLAEQTSYLTRLPQPLSLMADVLARTAGVQRLHYRDIADTLPLVQGLVR